MEPRSVQMVSVAQEPTLLYRVVSYTRPLTVSEGPIKGTNRW